MRSGRGIARWAVAAVGLAAVPLVGTSLAPLPPPGTATQVAALVAAAGKIEKLPADLVPKLADVGSDFAGVYYPPAARTCIGLTSCVFGHPTSKTLVVLYGDSHAEMWLPALVPIAKSEGWRLVLVWRPGCPAADVSVWDPDTHNVDAKCNGFRTSMLADIAAAHPALVLLASRTSDVPGPHNELISDATWKAGLEATIKALLTPKTKVAVIGDVTAYGAKVPLPECLVANPDDVQACTVANPNPRTHQHFAAELAAAQAEDVPYLNPQPWLCTTICSPVVGNYAVYYDSYHVAATYAEFLSGVWLGLLKKDGLAPLAVG